MLKNSIWGTELQNCKIPVVGLWFKITEHVLHKKEKFTLDEKVPYLT